MTKQAFTPVAILTLLLALQISLGCRQPGVSTETPPAPATIESAVPPATSALPDLKGITADLDGDGTAEQISTKRGENRSILAISSAQGTPLQELVLPEGAEFTSLQTQDLTADGKVEALFWLHSPQTDAYYLWVMDWNAGQGRFLAPQGDDIPGQAFFSYYYPPWIEDLLSDGYLEIIVSRRGASDRYLTSVVFHWDGNAFRRNQGLIVPPRLLPTPRS